MITKILKIFSVETFSDQTEIKKQKQMSKQTKNHTSKKKKPTNQRNEQKKKPIMLTDK